MAIPRAASGRWRVLIRGGRRAEEFDTSLECRGSRLGNAFIYFVGGIVEVVSGIVNRQLKARCYVDTPPNAGAHNEGSPPSLAVGRRQTVSKDQQRPDLV